jgi:hypothetical protein
VGPFSRSCAGCAHDLRGAFVKHRDLRGAFVKRQGLSGAFVKQKSTESVAGAVNEAVMNGARCAHDLISEHTRFCPAIHTADFEDFFK